MAAADYYPTPFPGYTEHYIEGRNSDNACGAGCGPESMAYWTGGPSPDATPLSFPTVAGIASENGEKENFSDPPLVHQAVPPEKYLFPAMNNPSLVVPGSSHMGSPDSTLQVFQHNIGGNFPFYESAPGSGMPAGYFATLATAAAAGSSPQLLGPSNVRKATRKKLPIVNGNQQQQQYETEEQQYQTQQADEAFCNRPRIEKKKYFPCC